MAKAEKSKPKPRRNYRKPSTRKSSNKTTEKVV